MSDDVKPIGSTYFVLEAAGLRAEIERLHEITQQQARRLEEKDSEIKQMREQVAALQGLIAHWSQLRALEQKP